jgi:EmrB/QacA subfamily drug resistance transporter
MAPGEQHARLQGWALASVLFALMVTLLLSALDQTIVGTALPKIVADLNGLDRLSWVGTAYLLTSATLIPIVGKLSDQFGRKGFLIASVVIFLLGSALCGTSQSMNQLILYRGLQGVGAAGLMTLTFTLVGDIFPPRERPKWQGVFGTVFGVSSVIGPLIGGWITDNSTWRWVFYVNLPVGIVALTALTIWLPKHISARTSTLTGRAAIRRIDWAGAALSGAATLCLLLGLTWGSLGPTYGGYVWGSQQVIGVLVVAGVLYVAFFVNERIAREPILPLSFMRNQVFAVDAVLSLLLGMAFLAIVYYLPTFIQAVMGMKATESGLVVTPMTFTLVIASVAGGRLVSRFGRYQWLVISGAVIFLAGTYMLTRITPSATVPDLVPAMLVVGFGLGCIMPILTLAIQNAVPRTQLGVATSSITYLRSLGSTFGLAIIGSVMNSSFTSQLNSHFPAPPQGAPAQQIAVLKDLNIIEALLTSPAARDQVYAQAIARIPQGPFHAQAVAAATRFLDQAIEAGRVALGTAIVDGFWVALIVAVAMLITSFFLKDVPLRSTYLPAGGMAEGAAVAEVAPEMFQQAEIPQGALAEAGAEEREPGRAEGLAREGVTPFEGA